MKLKHSVSKNLNKPFLYLHPSGICSVWTGKLLNSVLPLIFCLSCISPAFAGDFMLGLSTGPAIGFDGDFNNQNIKAKTHLNLGVETFYKLKCLSGGFCEDLYIEASFDMVLSSKYNFGSIQVRGNGQTGNFSESVKYYSGNFSLRKHFFKFSKFKPVIGFGLGLSHLALSNISFNDSLGVNIPLNISSSSLNFEITPTIGLYYEISHKLSVDLLARFHLLVPATLNNSFLEIPVGIKYSF